LKFWAIHAYRSYLAKGDRNWTQVGISDLVSLYIDFEVYVKADYFFKNRLRVSQPKREFAGMR
jgi:hypothetical protein